MIKEVEAKSILRKQKKIENLFFVNKRKLNHGFSQVME